MKHKLEFIINRGLEWKMGLENGKFLLREIGLLRVDAIVVSEDYGL